MQRVRKPASGQMRGRSKLVKEIEKLAAALERSAAHLRGHSFGPVADAGEGDFVFEEPKAA
jgi:acyl-CoA synthetase (NDP forming)